MSIRFNAERAREAALAHGDKSQYSISKRTGLSEATISRLFNGRTGPNGPLGNTIHIIARTYSVPAEELIAEDDEEEAAA